MASPLATTLLQRNSMKKGKTKLTRHDAERLFEGLPAGNVKTSSRPENPFEAGAFDVVERVDEESKLWKVKAWRVKWVREGKNEVVTDFPEGWSAVRPESGPIQLRDPSGVVRALYGWAADAELRILPRYLVESQTNSSSGLGSLIVRDRMNGQILERSSIWSAQTGTNHPDWTRLSVWLKAHYPEHHDPLRYWEDCEQNMRN
jgi:hypothetical protein